MAVRPPWSPAGSRNFRLTVAAHDPGLDQPGTVIPVPDTGTCLIDLSFAGPVGNLLPPHWLRRHQCLAAVTVMPTLVAPPVLCRGVSGNAPAAVRPDAAAVTVSAGAQARGPCGPCRAAARYLVPPLPGVPA